MPKEITHFILAGKMGSALPRTSAFSEAIARYPRLFRLGAVAPDINFYCLGPKADQIQALSSFFHTSDETALLPVLRFLESRTTSGARPDPALALAAGAICHILSDTQFHPMVYYYAGMDGVHKGATVRHRQFETAMDLYFWKQESLAPEQTPGLETRLNRLVSSLEISRSSLIQLLTKLFRPGALGKKGIDRALRCHTGLQTLFCLPWIKKIMARANASGHPLPEMATSLVYPFDHPVDLSFFSGQMVFYDPCTREKIQTRISIMVQKTVESGLKVLELISKSIEEDRPLTALLSHPDLPVIRPGLPAEGFTLWQDRSDIMPWLYRGYSPPF